ncbi:tail assembly protein [Caudoviricetes sp.]|nr:tail assembly protein [Caudoviricetes sp.]
MSDVDTGTNPFPTSGQFSGGLYARKSVTANSTARPWICIANDSAFYIFLHGNRTGAYTPTGWDGGDGQLSFGTLVNTRVASDINASFLCAASDSSATSTTASGLRQCVTAFSTSAQATLYLNGSYDQISSVSTQCNQRGMVFLSLSAAQSGAGGVGTLFPDPITGAFLLSPITVVESALFAVRGDMPGIRALGPLFSGSGMPTYTTIIEGMGPSTGRSFLVVGTGASSAAAFDLGDWDG